MDLLERETELAALAAMVEAAAEARGTAAAILAPAGIGKTSLLDATRALAEHCGFAVLDARGGELERGFAWGVARQLLERPLRDLPAGEREVALAGAARLAAPFLGADDDAPGPSDPFAVAHALYWVCVNLADRRPVLVTVDDLHWADPASLRFLAYLVRRVSALPVLVLTAARPAVPDTHIELLDAVTSAPEVRMIRPSPLSEAAVAEVVAAAVGGSPGPEVVRACWLATGGNPFLCRVLASSLAEYDVELPAAEVVELAAQAVSTLVTRRLGRLGPEAAALAEAVSMLGADADLRLAAGLADLDEVEAARAADGLTGQGILTAGRPLEFVHPLVRTAVRDEIPAAKRLLWHGRAARLLDRAGASVDAVAAQLLATEPAADPWAVDRLVMSARDAARRGAPEAAASRLRRALIEPPECGVLASVLHELGRAELVIGDVQSAVEHLEEARTLTEDRIDRVLVARDVASALSVAGRYEWASAAIDAALLDLPQDAMEVRLGLQAQRFAHAAMAPRPPGAPAPAPGWNGPEPEGRTPGERAYLAALATNALIFLDHPERMPEWGRRAVEGGIVEELTGSGAVWHPMAYALTFADCFHLVGRMVADGLRRSDARGSPLGLARAYQTRAVLRLRQGCLRDAAADARLALDLGRDVGLAGRVVALAALVESLIELGEPVAAQLALAEAGGEDEIALHFFGNFALYARGCLRLAQRQYPDAIADFTELGRRGHHWHPWNPGIFAFRSRLATALMRNGDRRGAAGLAAEELELARRWGAPRAVGVALRTLGLATAGDAGVPLLRDSVATLQDSGARLEHAHSIVQLGAAIRRAGKRSEAKELLHTGMDLAHRCGARPLVERARQELVSAGSRPRRMARIGVDALTPSELRVATLAAEGMTNRDIAQTLFVTLRTVELHLTHTYQKLGVTSRQALAQVLAATSRQGRHLTDP